MRESASWINASTKKTYNCGYGACTAGDYILKGTYLYHAGTKITFSSDSDVELGVLRPWVYFSTCKARCEQFGGGIQTFTVSQNLPATYAGKKGGEEYAEEFFQGGDHRIAYFSDKECEVVIRSTYLAHYLEKPASITGAIWYYLTCCLPCCR